MKISGKQLVLLFLLGAAAFPQANQDKKLESPADHGKILWQFDTQG